MGGRPSAPPWESPRLVPGLWGVRAPPALLGVQPTDLRPWDRPRDRGSPQYIPLWGPPGSVSLEDPDSKTPDLLDQGARLSQPPAPSHHDSAFRLCGCVCSGHCPRLGPHGAWPPAPGLPRLACAAARPGPAQPGAQVAAAPCREPSWGPRRWIRLRSPSDGPGASADPEGLASHRDGLMKGAAGQPPCVIARAVSPIPGTQGAR